VTTVIIALPCLSRLLFLLPTSHGVFPLALLLHAVDLLVVLRTPTCTRLLAAILNVGPWWPCKRVGVIHRIRTRMQQGYASRASHRFHAHALPTTILHPPLIQSLTQ